MKRLLSIVCIMALIISQVAFASPMQPLKYVDEKQPLGFNIKMLDRYDSGAGVFAGGAEIVVFNKAKKWAYVANGAEKSVDILDLNTVATTGIQLAKRIKISDFALGDFKTKDITSVAVDNSGAHVAVAVPADPKQGNGRLVVLDAEGNFLKAFEVGALPDMVTFTPDGKKILVANEGEPNDDFSNDPNGSVSIINLADGIEAATVKNLDFTAYTRSNLPEGIKIIDREATTVAQDLEPEYITVNDMQTFAFVSLQEANAIAVIDLATDTWEGLYALGSKDHSLTENALDVSNKDGKINITTWPTRGLYQPDGITSYEHNGITYILTANEGDAKDYDGYSEEVRVKDIVDQIALSADNYDGYTQEQLDQLVANGLFDNEQLGRLKITTAMGKNKDGKFETLYNYGGRSMSVYMMTKNGLEMVYDSGRLFEDTTAKAMAAVFNTDGEFDGRSDDKGPEPEDVKVGTVYGKPYAFVGLERQNAIVMMDISNPTEPTFAAIFTTAAFGVSLEDVKKGTKLDIGDIGPEGLKFIAAEDSPTGMPLLLVASEVSGTVAAYSFEK